MDFSELINQITRGFTAFTWGNAVMILAGLVLVFLAVVKEYEPVLLLPIGFGCVLANLGMSTETGIFKVLYYAGIDTGLFPLLIFIGIGAMIDFRPLLSMPKMALLGAAGQFGIYTTLLLAILLGFPMAQAASIGSIGSIDGPTAIFVTSRLAPEILAPVTVAAYSYMSLVPIIQIPVMKLLTTRKERLIRMDYAARPVSNKIVIAFPIIVTVMISLLAPDAAPLIATLMLGNLLREAGVVERLMKAAQNEIINIATLFLGLTIGATMTATSFLNVQTLMILGLGLLAFIIDTVAGLMFGKFLSFATGGKINPLIGASGISAFPMAGRLAARVAKEEDFDNFILMHAVGANTAGQLGSVIAGGLLLALTVSIAGIM